MANGLSPGINPLPQIALQRLLQQRAVPLGNQPQGGLGQRLGGLLSGANPLLNVGLGLLASSGPRPQGTSSFGSRLAEAMQFANQRELAAAQNALIRQQLLAQQQRQEALAQLPGLLSQTRVAQAPSTQVTGIGGEQLGTIPGRQAVVPLMATPQGQQQLMGLLGQIAPDAFAKVALESLFAQPQRPTGVEADLQAIESRVGPLTREEIFSIANAGGTQINIGDRELDKPMSPSEIATLRTPEGGTLPLGTTPRQAAALGARVFTASELSRRSQVENALGVFQQLQDLAVGPEGVFRGVPDNLLGRWAEGLGNFFGDVFGTAESVRRETYTSLSRGTVGPLIRSLGESGALADKDVERALSLLSDIEGVPEGESVAKSKFRELGQILNRAAANVGVDTASGRDVIDLGGGVTLEFID